MPSETASSSEGKPGITGNREMQILLVEDFPALRMRLAELLTHPGVMRVAAIADTEADACELITAGEFDALVVDVELRQGSGIGVLRGARARWTRPPLPLIIVLTNHTLPAVEQRCRAAGADHFLDKLRQFDQVYRLILQRRTEQAR